MSPPARTQREPTEAEAAVLPPPTPCPCCANVSTRPLSDVLLPDMKALQFPAPNTTFTKLLFDREYALMLNELYALREDLFGSRALIAMVKEGKTPVDLNNALASRYDKMWDVFTRVKAYVRDATWGDAGMRYRGLLPKVPETPLVPFVTALRAKSMDWTDFYDFLERECREGSLKGNRSWVTSQGEVRRHRIQATLDALSKKYIDLVKVNQLAFWSEDDHVRMCPQSQLDAALALMKAPPGGSAQAPSRGSTGIALSRLEVVHSSGLIVRKHLATQARKLGDLYFEKLCKAEETGKYKDDVLIEYGFAKMDMEQHAAACVDIAVMHDELGEFGPVANACYDGLMALERWKAEPVSLAARRALTVRQLRTGKLAKSPNAPSRKFTDEQKQAYADVTHELYLRKGRAHADWCLLLLKGDEPLDSVVADRLKRLITSAKSSFDSCYKLDPNDPTPLREMLQLTTTFEAEMQRRDKAGSSSEAPSNWRLDVVD